MSKANPTPEAIPSQEINPTPEITTEDTTVDDGKVELYIERSGPRTEQQVMIGVNGVNFIIPKGKRVRVPKYVADEYHRSVAARDVMYERKEELIQEDVPQIG